ncbi:NFATC2-interacting protein isoform X2 [Nerophis ophidion]|uniref:NFATC2-interacting protein isoform X2 n=1 Tax=Nerophis ophidion TaxID=159077 RepID=UPI002ADF5279|nr:NFATC2-interacting protein isoform X2 [Nerophis ophidion]
MGHSTRMFTSIPWFLKAASWYWTVCIYPMVPECSSDTLTNMADALSDITVCVAKPPPKRRRILDSSAIVPVPVYSNKVNSSLHLKLELPPSDPFVPADQNSLWSQMSCREHARADVLTLSDSEDEQEVPLVDHGTDQGGSRPLSPPPEDIPVQKQSRQFQKKINEVNRRLRAVSDALSPDGGGRVLRRRRGEAPKQDDVIIVESESHDWRAEESRLKVRCRTEVYKLPVLSTTLLKEVASQLSAILHVPSHRLLLLREEAELPGHASVRELGLGIADILECVVMATERGGLISVRLQGKERGSARDFSVDKEAELGAIFSQYVSAMPARARRKVQFHFDGCKVAANQTPAQLDMEDGDIIEVWM